MGYYTSFCLKMFGDKDHIEQFESALLDESKDADGNVNLNLKELIETGYVYAKLYELSDWINSVAPKYPDVLIVLSGDGEESDDKWEERWKGNESEYQKAIIPPFVTLSLLTDYEIANRTINL